MISRVVARIVQQDYITTNMETQNTVFDKLKNDSYELSRLKEWFFLNNPRVILYMLFILNNRYRCLRVFRVSGSQMEINNFRDSCMAKISPTSRISTASSEC